MLTQAEANEILEAYRKPREGYTEVTHEAIERARRIIEAAKKEGVDRFFTLTPTSDGGFLIRSYTKITYEVGEDGSAAVNIPRVGTFDLP